MLVYVQHVTDAPMHDALTPVLPWQQLKQVYHQHMFRPGDPLACMYSSYSVTVECFEAAIGAFGA